MTRIVALPLVLSAIGLGLTACGTEPPLDVAPHVDLTRFQGKWYEIASLPRTTQVDCYGTTAFYSPQSDGSYSFVNQCNVASTTGPLRTVTMKATVPNQAVPAKLAVDVGGFTGDYWILDVGANYEYAVVGHPTRMYLWILSRTPTLDEATLKGVLDRATENNFNTAKLQYTPQPPPGDRLSSTTPVQSPSSTASGGCAISAEKGGAAATWPTWLALALTVWRPRRLRLAIREANRKRAERNIVRPRRSSAPGCSGCT
jgi:apolipoprotein D and lipocalin family protein